MWRNTEHLVFCGDCNSCVHLEVTSSGNGYTDPQDYK